MLPQLSVYSKKSTAVKEWNERSFGSWTTPFIEQRAGSRQGIEWGSRLSFEYFFHKITTRLQLLQWTLELGILYLNDTIPVKTWNENLSAIYLGICRITFRPQLKHRASAAYDRLTMRNWFYGLAYYCHFVQPEDSVPRKTFSMLVHTLSHINAVRMFLSYFYTTILMLFSHLRLGFSNCLIPSEFPTKSSFPHMSHSSRNKNPNNYRNIERN